MAVKQTVVDCVPQSAETHIQQILRLMQVITAENKWEENIWAHIVVNLGTVQIPNDPEDYVRFIAKIKHVQEIFIEECTKNELKYAILKTLYKEITESEKTPSPAMSIVLELINIDTIPFTVVEMLHSGHSDSSLERALRTLCVWLKMWSYTENLGPLILELMRELNEQKRRYIVVAVTVDHIEALFRLLILPDSRKGVGPVVMYMLKEVAFDSIDIFHKVLNHVENVVVRLNKEHSESSVAYLQDVVVHCLALMDHYSNDDESYESLRKTLEPYAPMACRLLALTWKSSGSSIQSSGLSRASCDRVGLNNLGNTCYMNSVLQALFMTRAFRNEVLLYNGEMMPLFAKLQTMFALLQYSQKNSLSPIDILNLARPPGFHPGHQHDSSEFLGYLLDILHEQERSVTAGGEQTAPAENGPTQNTIVQTVFGGRTVTVASCRQCGTNSSRYDSFRELQLSFPNTNDGHSVQTLLDYYLQPEKLNGDNQYHCDVCDCLQDGERVTQIIDAPRHLILTLKHFRYDPKSQQRTKLLQKVRLDSQVHLMEGQYELCAAVVHWGISLDSGHYYTFARDANEWYKFNDCTVVRSCNNELYSLKPPETPYILFYARQESDDPGDLPLNVLSRRLQLVIEKDRNEYETERRKRTLKSFTITKDSRKDDQPPPGCGGNGFSTNSSNMYVC